MFAVTSVRHLKLAILVAVTALAAVGVFLHDPVPQPANYHSFADQRTIWGIPHFWNVISNLPFLLAGIAGIFQLRRSHAPGALPELRAACYLFFASAALVGLGSAWYHLAPANSTLAWDRLPMSIAFMAFVAIIFGEHVAPRLGSRLLFPMAALGVVSVLYWHFTEQAGRGDLRLYILVQFLPALLIPLILLMFRSALSNAGCIWALLGIYAGAKLLEHFDEQIHRTLRVISGHSLKHLLAASGVYLFLLALLRRRPLTLPPRSSLS